tara:strand:- start:34 stop:618 length:585 start_codon:yes stop_codon:yes gene_type:complete
MLENMLSELFSVPTKNLDFKHLDLKSIEEYCLSKTETSLTYSNEGGYHSNFFDLKNDKVLHPLCTEILSASKQFCDELDVKRVTQIQNMWSILNKYSHYNREHIHPNSFFSGVFYPGENYPNDCGALSFVNPAFKEMGYDWDDTQINFNKHNSLVMNIKPQRGMCLIFPSYISHFVYVNRNKDIDRLVISFNLK